MYLPQQFEETRPSVLHDLIRSHPLGTLVILAGGQLCANHMPFLLQAGQGDIGTLCGHVSRTNPLWQQLGSAVQALTIFQGPEAYITPSWYPSKLADGRVVPTWNYAVVHAYGKPRAIEDSAWLREHVGQLTAVHEAGKPRPWSVEDAPQEYIEQMLGRIVGIEIPLSRIEGKWKVSQNRKMADRLGAAAGLQSMHTEQSLAMAELIRQRAGAP